MKGVRRERSDAEAHKDSCRHKFIKEKQSKISLYLHKQVHLRENASSSPLPAGCALLSDNLHRIALVSQRRVQPRLQLCSSPELRGDR